MIYIYTAVLILIAGLSWGLHHEHAGKVSAQHELSDYKAAQEQAATDQKKQQQDDQRAAEQKAKDAEAQHEQNEVDHQHLVDTLTGRLRQLQAALGPHGVPPTMADTGAVQGGSTGTGTAGGARQVPAGLAAAASAAIKACLKTSDDKLAIIATEPER